MVVLSLNLNQLRTKEAPALQFELEPNPLCTSFSSRDALMNFICLVVWDLICYSYWMHKPEAESQSRNIFSSCFGVWRHNIVYKPVLNSRGDCEQFNCDIYGAKRGEGQKEEWFLGLVTSCKSITKRRGNREKCACRTEIDVEWQRGTKISERGGSERGRRVEAD